LICPRYKGIYLRHGHTSGTTGTPLDVCYDIKTCVVHHVADWRQKTWAGLNYGERYASLQGRVIVPIQQKKPPFWRKNYLNNQLFMSAFHLTKENLFHYFEKLTKDKIQYIEGYPSNLYILALFLNQTNQTFPIKAVLTSSETLFLEQRCAIERAFCCKVFDFYGMAERVVFATECDKHSGHHLNLDYGITEFLDSNGTPSKKGKLGCIVATNAFPLIRYKTNDASSLRTESCRCGRGFPLMDHVATKNESIITLPDGRLLSPSALTHPFKPMTNIIESQIVQMEVDKIVIKIVKNKFFTKEQEATLIRSLRERIGKSVEIDVRYVDHIERSFAGKLQWVISKIDPKY
jgi:phenylacetate-CoA ligase